MTLWAEFHRKKRNHQREIWDEHGTKQRRVIKWNVWKDKANPCHHRAGLPRGTMIIGYSALLLSHMKDHLANRSEIFEILWLLLPAPTYSSSGHWICFLVTHSFLASQFPHHPVWMDLSSLCCYYSVSKLCPTPCDPTDCSTPGFSVPHQLPEFTQVHVHWLSDAIQPSHPLLSYSNIMCQVENSWGWGRGSILFFKIFI